MREVQATHVSVEMAELEAPAVAPHAVRATSVAELFAALLRSLEIMVDTVSEWRERARQRRKLIELDDRLLKDIGLTRADARREWRKPFWRP